MADIARELVERIMDNPGITPDELARTFEVSVRTLRKYVADANRALAAAGTIELKRGKGFRIACEDAAAVRSWMDSRRIPNGVLPATADERVAWIATNLLIRNDWVTLDTLADALYISRTSVSGDLREVEALLARHGLTIARKPNHGIKVNGSEQAKRLCLAHNIQLEVGAIFDVVDADATIPELSFPLASIVGELVLEATSENDFRINTAAYKNLVVHVSIALIRILQGQSVRLDPVQIDTIAKTKEHAVAERFATRLEAQTGIALPASEIAYLTIHLAGKEAFLEDQIDTENHLVIEDDVWEIVSEMVEMVRQAYKIDLTEDFELRVNLARHIIPLTVRLRYGMKLENPLLKEIKSNYAFAYQMARDASVVLRRRFQTRPSDDEIGYIALAFALSLERRQHRRMKKNILFVCASGMAGARLLEYYYKKEFSDYISDLRFTDVQHLEDEDFDEVDYVFTTVPLSIDLPVPVLQISNVFNASIACDVRRFFEDGTAQNLANPVFGPNLFFPFLETDPASDVPPKRQVLDFLCARIEETGDVEPGFSDLVLKREEIISTAMGNRVAIAHPIEVGEGRPTGALAILDKPIAWDRTGNQVQVVFLVSFSDLDPDAHSRLIRALTEICVSELAIDRLIAQRDWNTFMGMLEKYFE